MSKLLFLILICLAHSCVAWKGFYTTEYPKYTLKEQTISVVFTLEAPFKVVKQAPLSLSTVLDTSGSLEGRGLALLKATTQFLIRKLAESNGLHSVGLVAYDSTVRELSEVVTATPSNVELLGFTVESIIAQGRTALSAGLNLGVQQQVLGPSGKIKSVYLFSDGLPNVGPTTIPEILSAVDGLLASTKEYISISTFGVGDGIDYGLLSAIADRYGGDTYVIHRPEDIPVAFGKALGGLKTIVGTEIEVIFTTFPGCRIKSVKTGGIYTKSSFTVLYDNLYAGELRDILFEVELGVGPVGFEKCLKTEYYYVDAVTRERLTGGSFVLEVERIVTVDVIFPAKKVEESRVKYIVADACILAKTKLLEGDKAGALEFLLSAKSVVSESVLKDSSVIEALLYDMDVLISDVEKDDESSISKIGKIGNLVSVLEKQRSVSTETDEFKSDEIVETEEQKAVKDEIQTSVTEFLETEEESEEIDSDALEDTDAVESETEGIEDESLEDTEEEEEIRDTDIASEDLLDPVEDTDADTEEEASEDTKEEESIDTDTEFEEFSDEIRDTDDVEASEEGATLSGDQSETSVVKDDPLLFASPTDQDEEGESKAEEETTRSATAFSDATSESGTEENITALETTETTTEEVTTEADPSQQAEEQDTRSTNSTKEAEQQTQESETQSTQTTAPPPSQEPSP